METKDHQFSSVKSLSHVRLFATPWIATSMDTKASWVKVLWEMALFTMQPQHPLLGSLVAQRLKHLPALQETWLRSLGQEDPKEQEMATDSSILPWKTLWTEEPSRLQSMGSRRFSNWIHTRTGCFKAVYRSSLVPLDGRCVSEEPIRIGTQDLDLICVSGY